MNIAESSLTADQIRARDRFDRIQRLEAMYGHKLYPSTIRGLHKIAFACYLDLRVQHRGVSVSPVVIGEPS